MQVKTKLLSSLILLLVFGMSSVLYGYGSSNNNGLLKKTLVVSGIERSYYIHVPPIYKDINKLPVLFVLHGGGKADGDDVAEYTGFNDTADREGFIAVYPNGVDAQWNDGRGHTFRKSDNTNTDDVGYISALIDEMINKYKGDSTRIYVTGLSNGGQMALRLGCEIDHKLSAIAPVIANVPKNIIGACSPKFSLPVMLMNGTEDKLVPWNGGHVRFLRKTMGEVISTDETIRFWASNNRCGPNTSVKMFPDRDTKDGSVVYETTYRDCKNNSEVVLYTVKGGGHSLPGSNAPKRRILGNKNNDIVGAEVIWSFLKRHSR